MADARQDLIDGLNEDLAAEYQAVIMYRSYASLVSGPNRPELRAFFESEIPDELGHAAFLADKIVALGGAPTTRPAEVPVRREQPRRCWRTRCAARRRPSSATRAASTGRGRRRDRPQGGDREPRRRRDQPPRRHPPHAEGLEVTGGRGSSVRTRLTPARSGPARG